jgi:hypothetical protein
MIQIANDHLCHSNPLFQQKKATFHLPSPLLCIFLSSHHTHCWIQQRSPPPTTPIPNTKRFQSSHQLRLQMRQEIDRPFLLA